MSVRWSQQALKAHDAAVDQMLDEITDLSLVPAGSPACVVDAVADGWLLDPTPEQIERVILPLVYDDAKRWQKLLADRRAAGQQLKPREQDAALDKQVRELRARHPQWRVTAVAAHIAREHSPRLKPKNVEMKIRRAGLAWKVELED